MNILFWANRVGKEIGKPHTFATVLRNLTVLFSVFAFIVATVVTIGWVWWATAVWVLTAVLWYLSFVFIRVVNLDKELSTRKQEKLGRKYEKYLAKLTDKNHKKVTKKNLKIKKKNIRKSTKAEVKTLVKHKKMNKKR